MVPGLIEQEVSYSMHCCESHVKEQENLLQKEAKYHAEANKNCQQN